MAFLAVLRAARSGLTDAQKAVLRLLPVGVNLATPDQVEPPVWTHGGQEWVVYYDPRFTLEDAAIAAAVLNDLASLPDPEGEEGPKSKEALLEEVRATYSYTVPTEVPEGEDSFSHTLTLNGAPAVVWMSREIPEGWEALT